MGLKQFFLDGYESLMTGLGTRKDKMQSGRPVMSKWTDDDFATWVEVSWLANRIVSKLGQDALSSGVSIEIPDDKAASKAANDYLTRLKLVNALRLGSRWARTFGGAGMLIGAQDGVADYREPLDMSRIATVKYLTVMDAGKIHASAYQTDPTEPGYEWPSMYNLSGSGAAVGSFVHASRVARFEGAMARAPGSARHGRRGGWGESVLAQIQNDGAGFEQAWAGVWNSMAEYSVGVFKKKDLHADFAAGNGDQVLERVSQLDMGKSVFRSLLMDLENESYERVAINFQGVPDILQRAMILVAAGADIPVSELFGVSASGLSATGDSDRAKWHLTVDNYRTDALTPAIRQVADAVFFAKDGPTRGRMPASYEVVWPALYTAPVAEQATTRKTMAETDQIYQGMGVMTARDVAMSRFGGRAYSVDTVVDVSAISDEDAALEGRPVDGDA